MPRMKGSRALVELLRAEGVKYVFANPGTTELAFIDALQDAPDVKYMLTLFEGVAAGMADGYARITQRPSFMNFHISVGVANSIAVMYNSFRGGTPMVITAGQSHTSLQLHEPNLYSNMVNVMREYTKWSGEIVNPWDVVSVMRRAFKIASTPPTGPVFVSLAWDSMEGEADVDIYPSIADYHRIRPDADALERAVRLLAQAQNPLMLIGDRVSQSPGAPQLVARVAEQLGAPVLATSFSEVHMPSSHPHYLGAFNGAWIHKPVLRRLHEADAILAVGANLLTPSVPIPEPVFSGPPKTVHLDSSPWSIQRSYPVAAGLHCDIKTGLEELSHALDDAMSGPAQAAARERGRAVAQEKAKRQEAFMAQARERWDHRPMSPERFALELKKALPPDVIVCDDSITNRDALLSALDFDTPGSLVGGRGGSLGFGMGATLGVKLASPDRPVVGIIGDGTAMYTVQALWTAASYNIPVVYVICNNSSYKALRENMTRYLTGTERQSRYLGMDFYNLPLDFVKQANAYGIEGIRVEDPAELAPAVTRALDAGKPIVIDAIIDDSFDPAAIQEAWGQWWTAG